MSDNTVNLASDSKVETLSRSFPDSPHPSLSNDHMGLEVTSISHDSESEWVYGNSLEEDNSSSRSLDSLIPNFVGRINHAEVPIPPYILSQWDGLARHFIQVRLKTLGYEPRDAKVLEHLNLQGQPIVLEYKWVDAKVKGTSSALSIKASLNDANIMVGDPLEWLVLLVQWGKMLCSSFDDCMVPFYEFLFAIVFIQLPFSEFEVAILNIWRFPLPSFIRGRGYMWGSSISFLSTNLVSLLLACVFAFYVRGVLPLTNFVIRYSFTFNYSFLVQPLHYGLGRFPERFYIDEASDSYNSLFFVLYLFLLYSLLSIFIPKVLF